MVGGVRMRWKEWTGVEKWRRQQDNSPTCSGPPPNLLHSLSDFCATQQGGPQVHLPASNNAAAQCPSTALDSAVRSRIEKRQKHKKPWLYSHTDLPEGQGLCISNTAPTKSSLQQSLSFHLSLLSVKGTPRNLSAVATSSSKTSQGRRTRGAALFVLLSKSSWKQYAPQHSATQPSASDTARKSLHQSNAYHNLRQKKNTVQLHLWVTLINRPKKKRKLERTLPSLISRKKAKLRLPFPPNSPRFLSRLRSWTYCTDYILTPPAATPACCTQGHAKEWEGGRTDKRASDGTEVPSWEPWNREEAVGEGGRGTPYQQAEAPAPAAGSAVSSKFHICPSLKQAKSLPLPGGERGRKKETKSTIPSVFKHSMKTDRKCILEWIPTGCRGRGKGKRIRMFLLPLERPKKITHTHTG